MFISTVNTSHSDSDVYTVKNSEQQLQSEISTVTSSQQLDERELCSVTTIQQKVRSDVSTLNSRRKQVLYEGEESEITIELVDQVRDSYNFELLVLAVYFSDILLVLYVSLRSLEQNQSITNTMFGNISSFFMATSLI